MKNQFLLSVRCACSRACTSEAHTYGGQRTTWRSWLSPSIMHIQEIKVVRLGGTCLYPLSHPANPIFPFQGPTCTNECYTYVLLASLGLGLLLPPAEQRQVPKYLTWTLSETEDPVSPAGWDQIVHNSAPFHLLIPLAQSPLFSPK